MEDDVAGLRHRDGVARAVEHRVGPVGRIGVGDELLRRQLGPLEVAHRHAGAADQQLALFAGPEQVERLVGDIDGIIRDRAADGDGPARPHLGGGRHHGGLGRAVGVEQAPRAGRPARHQRLGQGLAAEQDEADARQIAGDHREQGRHGVEHGDAGFRDDRGQRFDVAHHGGARHEQAGADEIGNPDLLHREIEGDRGALEHHVVGAQAVDGVARAQEVADVGVADADALRHAGRARGVDQVGRVLRGETRRIQIGRGGALPRRQHLRRRQRGRALRCLGMQGFRDEERLGLRIAQADRDAVGGRLGVEGKPGGPGFRDADLRDQQFGAAGHPEAHHIPRADTAGEKSGGDGVGAGIDLRIGQDRAVAAGAGLGGIDQAGGVRARPRARPEQGGQGLPPDQVGAGRSAQDGAAVVAPARPVLPPPRLGEAAHPMLCCRFHVLPIPGSVEPRADAQGARDHAPHARHPWRFCDRIAPYG